MVNKEDYIKLSKTVLKSGKIVFYSIFLLAVNFLKAGDIPWVYEESTNYDFIGIIPGEFPIEKNDAIGIFGTNPNTLESNCLGYLIWNGKDTIFKAYGDDGTSGNQVAGNYTLKLWKDKHQCSIDLDYAPISGSSNFIGNGFTSVLKITTPYSVFIDASYALFEVKDKHCGQSGQISYISNTVVGRYSPFEFTLYDDLNNKIATNNTGTYKGLDAGIYTFQAKDSKGCTSSIKVTLDSIFLDASEVDIETGDDICDKGGTLYIDTTTLINGKAPYRFILENNFTGIGTTSSKNEITGIDNGNYTLSIFDQNSCEETVQVSIMEDNFDCNKNNILAPMSSDPTANQISFDCQNNVKIIDNTGHVIKIISGDGSWNGTDATGNLVPNGTYFIYCNEQYLKSIEVLK